jgi:hypothetical protein
VLGAGLVGLLFNGILLPRYYEAIHVIWPVETARTIVIKIGCNCLCWGFVGNG